METLKISKIKPNPNNPRLIKDQNYKRLIKSITQSPAFMKVHPLKLDEDLMILGGNMRYRVCKELKWSEIPIEIFTREHAKENNIARKKANIEEATYEHQCRELIIKDNVNYGQDDYDILGNEWDEVEVKEWGLNVWQPTEDNYEPNTEPETTYGDVTKEEIEKEAQKLAIQMIKETKKTEVICPECETEFEIQ